MNVVDLDVWQGMMTAREIFFSLVPMLCCFFAARVLLHYFQLESYQFPGYFRTLNRNRKHAFLPGVCSAAVCLILFTLQNVWYTHALQSPETPPSAAMIWLITLGLLAVAVLGGGAAFYFKVYRPKQQAATEPEEDYGEELEDYDGEEDGPPWDEDEDENEDTEDGE